MTIITEILEQEEKLTPYHQGQTFGQTTAKPGNGSKPSKVKAKSPGLSDNLANVNFVSKTATGGKSPPNPEKQKGQPKQQSQGPSKDKKKTSNFGPKNKAKGQCKLCSSNHEEGDCPDFQSKSAEGRRNLAAKYKICYSCMRASCPGRNRCDRKDRKCYAILPDNSICTRNHHPLLHSHTPHDA